MRIVVMISSGQTNVEFVRQNIMCTLQMYEGASRNLNTIPSIPIH